jgi:DNA repair exonuclease SbcCD ATPase subunit
MRIDLSLLFTWRQIAKMKNSTNTNLLILDETFDSSLDEDGVDNLLKILLTLEDGTNTFIISHKPDLLENKLKDKLVFKRRNNFSEVS